MSDTHAKRREVFKARLAADAAGRHAVALFFSGEPNGLDAFDPDPTFYYLTGVAEPGAALAFFASPQKTTEQLFLPETNPAEARWIGKTLCAGGLTRSAEPDEERKLTSKTTGVAAIDAYHHLEASLVRPLRDAELFYLDFPGETASCGLERTLAESLRRRCPYLELRHGGRLAAELRRVKDKREIEHLRSAGLGPAHPQAGAP